MYSSHFAIRLWKWIKSPKKYKLVFLVCHKPNNLISSQYLRVEREIIAHSRREAINKGEQEIENEISISLASCHSLGKVTPLENIK
jgi:hypothetical protein